MNDTTDLAGKTTIVVGASRGLGRGIATAFAEAGATVVAVSRTAPELASRGVEDRRRFVQAPADLRGWDRWVPRYSSVLTTLAGPRGDSG